ncbi:MAG: sialidase family protein, partial [Ktedonobacteraceae bacterium]
MKTILRVLGAPLVIGLMVLISMSPAANASTVAQASLLPRSPLSSGFLMAQAIHSGAVKLSNQGEAASANPALKCSPAPCVLPNVQASGGGQPVNEDPIATNPTNHKNLLTGGNDYNCGSLQGFYASLDGGTTWNHTCMNTLSGASGDGDPGVGFDSAGTAYITGIDTGTPDGSDIVFEKSTNGGTTWSAPAVAVKPLFAGGLTDKDWLWVDNNASSPRVNSLYVSVTQFDSSQTRTEISVSHSTNGGSTWKTVGVDTEQQPSIIDQFSDVTTDKAGNVYVTWMRCPVSGTCSGVKASFLVSKSTDGGNTWSTPVTVNTANLAPGTCGYYGCIPNTNERLSNIPVIGVDNSTGKHAGYLYVENYNYTGKYISVQVTVSTDGGNTWGTPVAVAPTSDKHDQFFGWLSVSNTGQVGVTWMDRRNDPSNLSYEEFGAVAGGVNGLVNHNVQLATKPSNPNNDGFSGSFMGDYSGNAWAGKKLYASWMDTRSGTNS